MAGMTTYALTFGTAVAISYAAGRLVRRLARDRGAVDRPDGFRKLHARPVPLLGGVAVYLAFFMALPAGCLLAGQALADSCLTEAEFWWVFGGATAVLLTGMVDDVWGLRARWKFLLLGLISAAMYGGGFRIGGVSTPFGPSLGLAWLAAPVTLFWFMGCMNSVNLIDGMDGVAAGVSLFAAAAMAACAVLLGNASAAVLALALAGAAAGFLVLNFPPASLYLGDSGSLLLGFLLASIGILGAQKGPMVVALLVPAIALGLPIFDTSLAILRRWTKGLPFMAGDRQHLHHKLQELGLTQRHAALAVYGACIVLAAVALLLTASNSLQAALLLGVLAAVTILAFRTIGRHELAGLKRKLRGYVHGKKEQTKRRAAAYVATGSMRHADSVDELWNLLARAADRMGLDEVDLMLRDAELPPVGARRRYRWLRNGEASPDGHHATWSAHLPVRDNGRLLGRMEVEKRTNGKPLEPDIPETLELLARAFAINALRLGEEQRSEDDAELRIVKSEN